MLNREDISKYLQDSTEVVVSAAAITKESAKKAAEIARLRYAIIAEERKLKEAYTEIGRLYYRDHTAEAEEAAEDYQVWMDRAKGAKLQIQALTERLQTVRDTNA